MRTVLDINELFFGENKRGTAHKNEIYYDLNNYGKSGVEVDGFCRKGDKS